jgi:chemotaxis signal transduction protein
VETETSTHLVALDGVLHTFDYLPRAAVPDPDPVFAGAALCRGAWIPVVRLDVLLGEKGHVHQEIGGYVVVDGAREPVAIAMKRIVGVSYDCDSSRFLCLTAHLDERLAPISDSERDVVPIASCDAADDDRRYLLFDLGSQPCAVDIGYVENVLSDCAVVSTPPSSIVGLAGIAVVAGQALPVLDVAALLGVSPPMLQPISQSVSSAAGYVVIACSRDERYVVPVSNVGRVVSIAETACARAPDDALISSIATIAAQTVWILSTEALVRRSGWNSDAA